MSRARWPLGQAALVVLVVLAGYLVTLAPTVTFWDAGEFITAAKTLGIPHPPGTPLWVLLAHVWGLVVPFGDYAWRLNLMSAACGAIAAGAWFLVVHASAARATDVPRWVAPMAGWGAALVAAFSFTAWQNAVEAEVYSVALLTIALVALVAVAWRERRETTLGRRLLLVAIYLGALSIGNHLLALLMGPALVAFLVVESRTRRFSDPTAATEELARIAAVATVWLLLIALGLGSATLTLLTGALALAAAGWAATKRQAMFAVTALGLAVVGVSTYAFLYLRAQQGPWLNEADPSTWDALLAVIRRAQYPIRTPLDDPTMLHGPDNPGRSLVILGHQLANYAQWFDWQWASTLGEGAITAPLRLIVTIAAVSLGLRGARAHRRDDRAGFALVLVLFLVTGLGLVLYMNFKPGPSIGWPTWPELGQHEVRERDYFFVASFVAWALWIGYGIADLAAGLARHARFARLAPLVGVAMLVPAVLNVRDASRRHGADVTLARDFARALLESVPPGGILFTWGDNDTFPLWHAQAVDGVRRDVTIVCLALAETKWYLKQLITWRPAPVDPATLPVVWANHPRPDSSLAIHGLTAEAIDSFVPQYVNEPLTLPLPQGGALSIPARTPVYGKDLAVLMIVRENAGRRPITWSVTAAQKLFGVPVVQQGMGLTLPITPPDTTMLAGGPAAGAGGAPLDLLTTRGLLDSTWQLGAMLERGAAGLDPNIRAMANTIALPYAQAGIAMLQRGDTATAVRDLQRAARLAPDQPAIAAALAQLGQPFRR